MDPTSTPATIAKAYRALADAAAYYCIVPPENPEDPTPIYLTASTERLTRVARSLLACLTVDRVVYWTSDDTGTGYATFHARLLNATFQIQMYADDARPLIRELDGYLPALAAPAPTRRRPAIVEIGEIRL